MGKGLLAEAGDVLTVAVAGERLVFPAAEIVEVMRPRHLTRVPNGPASLLGLTNLRGTVLPVVSLAMLLGLPQPALSPSSRVVIIECGTPVGMLVDAVSALARDAGEPKVDLQPLLAREFSGLAQRSGGSRQVGTGANATTASERDLLALIGFFVDGQEFGLPLESVVEVALLAAAPTDIPHTGAAMMGVMAFRGGLLPLVSLRTLLGLGRDGFDRRKGRAVVVRVGPVILGLVVDSVSSVMRVPAEAIDAIPAVLTRGAAETQIAAICCLERGQRLICILSPARLLDTATTARLMDGGQQGADPAAQRQARDVATDRFVVFHLGDERYGLPISAVHTVVRRPAHLSPVPYAPAFIEGVMNLRGKLVPIINQRERFGVTGRAPSERSRVVVVAVDGLEAGLAVDAVSELVSLSARDRHAVPALNQGGTSLIDRVAPIEHDGHMILLLHPGTLLNQAERDVLLAMADTARLVAAS